MRSISSTQSGLDYELHAMGTIVEGELDEVLDLMRRCIEQIGPSTATASRAPRSSITAAATRGALKSKVASVEQKLGDAQYGRRTD